MTGCDLCDGYKCLHKFKFDQATCVDWCARAFHRDKAVAVPSHARCGSTDDATSAYGESLDVSFVSVLNLDDYRSLDFARSTANARDPSSLWYPSSPPESTRAYVRTWDYAWLRVAVFRVWGVVCILSI